MNLKLDSKHVAHIHVNSYWSATSMNFASANQRVVRIVYSSLFGSPLLITSGTYAYTLSLKQTSLQRRLRNCCNVKFNVVCILKHVDNYIMIEA